MKLNLETKIKAIIEAYKSFAVTQHEEIKAILEPFKVPSYISRFSDEGWKLTIKEQMDEVMSNWKNYDTVLNQKVKLTIADAKTTMLKAFGVEGDVKKPSDYAMQIANAREFLKMELSDEKYIGKIKPADAASIDIELYSILKDFINDYDTMKQFRKMVEKKVTTFSSNDGDCIFPKTFGKMCKIESAMNTIEELEADAEMLFLYKRTDSEEVIRIKGKAFVIPMDGYSQGVDEESIINNAVILDVLADSIDSEGQTFVADNPAPDAE